MNCACGEAVRDAQCFACGAWHDNYGFEDWPEMSDMIQTDECDHEAARALKRNALRILDEKARALYESNPHQVAPRWDQLGDTTKSVWRGYVLAGRDEQ